MKKLHPAFQNFFICLLYTGIFLVFSRPLIFNFHNSFISDYGDAPTFIWNIYNFTQAISDHVNPFFTRSIFYPVGTSLVLHTYMPILGVLNLFIGNPVLTLNIATILSFVLSGLGGYLLCRYFVPNHILAFTAGFVFAFCPYKMSHLSAHYNLILTATIPFYTLLLLKLQIKTNFGFSRIDMKKLAWLVILFCISFASDYYVSYFLLILTVAYIFFRAIKLDTCKIPVRIIILSTIAAILFSCAVIYFGELWHLRRTGFCYTFDLLNLITPAQFSHFFGTDLVRHIRTTVIKGGPLENTVFPGWTIVAIFFWALFSKSFNGLFVHRKLLLYFIAVFFIFASPIISIAGKPLFALPTVFLQYIPFVNNFRVPCRFSLMLMLFLPVFIAFFLHTTILPKLSRGKQYMLMFALVLTSVIEYLPKPYMLQSVKSVPEIYHTLASKPDGALLDIPFGIEGGFNELGKIDYSQPLYQTVHHKPTLGGYTSRISPDVLRFFQKYQVAVRLLVLSRTGGGFATVPSVLKTRSFLEATQLRYIVIPPQYLKKPLGLFIFHVFDGFIESEELIDGYTLLTISRNRQ